MCHSYGPTHDPSPPSTGTVRFALEPIPCTVTVDPTFALRFETVAIRFAASYLQHLVRVAGRKHKIVSMKLKGPLTGNDSTLDTSSHLDMYHTADHRT